MMSRDGAKAVFLYWLGGSGFVIKNKNWIIGIDLYLSDACQNARGEYKRLIPPPLDPADLKLDYLVATHEHRDHFDVGSIHTFLRSETNTKLIGPSTVIKECKKMGIENSRLIKLDRNESINLQRDKISGVFCDHGDQSLDAIGIILEIGGKSIYFTGDTCFRPDLYKLVPLNVPIDLLLVPINGKFGNPDAKEAAYIASWVKPITVIPCHYGLFREHGGNSDEFTKYCGSIVPEAKVEILAVGERFDL